MDYYLAYELVLIGYRNRTDADKTVFYKEEEHVPDLFFFFTRTEQPDRTGTNKSRLKEMDTTED